MGSRTIRRLCHRRFGAPGLLAARALADGPVAGIADLCGQISRAIGAPSLKSWRSSEDGRTVTSTPDAAAGRATAWSARRIGDDFRGAIAELDPSSFNPS
jgi:hypothetical protein